MIYNPLSGEYDRIVRAEEQHSIVGPCVVQKNGKEYLTSFNGLFGVILDSLAEVVATTQFIPPVSNPEQAVIFCGGVV